MSEKGQSRKSSRRAHVFRFGPDSGPGRARLPDVRFVPSSGLQNAVSPFLQVPVFACRAASLSISDCTACAAWPANSFCWVAAAA